MVEYKVKNKFTPAPMDSVRMTGYEGKLFDKFFYGRIFSDYAREEVYPEAEDAFKNQIDGESCVGIWQGEYWGKWIISAARVARYTHSEELREFIRRGAHKLMSYQRDDGYLGTYKNSAQFFLPTKEEAIAAVGAPNLWNWNVWCRKYTLWGMLECYMLLGEKEMLDSCIGMADYLIDELDRLGISLCDTGTFSGVASCSILKPMLILYRLTENKKYLDFALSFVDRWENADIKPGLIANALSGKRIREWYPDSNRWAKVYETMSCFDGIIELYRITGEEKYLKAAEGYWDILVNHEYNLLFSVGFNDVFGDAAYDLNCASEPCDVLHFMRLCYELFLLTGDVKYMDRFELAASTPLIASTYKNGRWGARALRGQGRHLTATLQAKFTRNHCCVNNMPRGIINFIEAGVMTDGECLLINLYTASESVIETGKGRVTVRISGEYLSDCRAKIDLTFDGEPTPVKLRVPSWSERGTVTVGDTAHAVTPGYFTFIPKGKSEVVTVAFDDTVRVIEVSSHPELGDIEWKRIKWVASSWTAPTLDSSGGEYISADPDLFIEGRACLLVRGASLLCRTKLIGSTEEEMFGERLLSPDYKCTSCKRIYTPADVNTELLLTFSDGKNELSYHVADYATGTNLMTLDKRFFSIYF